MSQGPAKWPAAIPDALEALVEGTDPAAAVAGLCDTDAGRVLRCAETIYPRIEHLAREIHALPTRDARVKHLNRYRKPRKSALRRHAQLAARLVARWDREAGRA